MGFLDFLLEAMVPRSVGRSNRRRRRSQNTSSAILNSSHQSSAPFNSQGRVSGGNSSQFGTRISNGQRTVDGFQTDAPQFFRQGSDQQGGAGMSGLNANAFNRRSLRSRSGIEGQQGRSSTRSGSQSNSRSFSQRGSQAGGSRNRRRRW